MYHNAYTLKLLCGVPARAEKLAQNSKLAGTDLLVNTMEDFGFTASEMVKGRMSYAKALAAFYDMKALLLSKAITDKKINPIKDLEAALPKDVTDYVKKTVAVTLADVNKAKAEKEAKAKDMPLCESYNVNISLNGVFFCEVTRITSSNLSLVLTNLKSQFTEDKGFKLSLIGVPYKTTHNLDINDYLPKLESVEDIKQAVLEGKTVYVGNKNYIVTKDRKDQWYVKCLSNGSLIGLTWADNKTLNYKLENFFI